jgi:hypothetical protein
MGNAIMMMLTTLEDQYPESLSASACFISAEHTVASALFEHYQHGV